MWDDSAYYLDGPAAPLFHRWLPNGTVDAITLLENDTEKVWVWFERKGYIDGSFIRYTEDADKQNFEITHMTRQAKLNAGHLRCRAELSDCTTEEFEALSKETIDEATFKKLGKRIAKLVPFTVGTFVDLLRVRFGQYWIEPVPKWDSTSVNLEGFLSGTLPTWYSVDNGITLKRFKFGQAQISTVVHAASKRDYEELLTEADWTSLRSVAASQPTPSIAETLLIAASEFRDRGQYRQAIVEAATALELAIGECLRRHAGALETQCRAFYNLPLPAQTVVLLTTTMVATHDETKNVTDLIATRNKIVHEGFDPGFDSRSFQLVLGVIARLLGNTTHKFPSVHLGNQLDAPNRPDI